MTLSFQGDEFYLYENKEYDVRVFRNTGYTEGYYSIHVTNHEGAELEIVTTRTALKYLVEEINEAIRKFDMAEMGVKPL